MVEADSGEEASTVPASPQQTGMESCVVPLQFEEFMRLYEQWSAGGISGELVKTKYGPATLEMLETQQMVQEGALDDTPHARGGDGQHRPDTATTLQADTLLDAMLECTTELGANGMSQLLLENQNEHEAEGSKEDLLETVTMQGGDEPEEAK